MEGDHFLSLKMWEKTCVLFVSIENKTIFFFFFFGVEAMATI